MIEMENVLVYEMKSMITKVVELMGFTRDEARFYLIGILVEDKEPKLGIARKKIEETKEVLKNSDQLFDNALSYESMESIFNNVKSKTMNKFYLTENYSEVISIKANSLPAGLQDRFSVKKVTAYSTDQKAYLGKRLEKDIVNFGYKNAHESVALEKLNAQTNQKFTLNSKLAFTNYKNEAINGLQMQFLSNMEPLQLSPNSNIMEGQHLIQILINH